MHCFAGTVLGESPSPRDGVRKTRHTWSEWPYLVPVTRRAWSRDLSRPPAPLPHDRAPGRGYRPRPCLGTGRAGRRLPHRWLMRPTRAKRRLLSAAAVVVAVAGVVPASGAEAVTQPVDPGGLIGLGGIPGVRPRPPIMCPFGAVRRVLGSGDSSSGDPLLYILLTPRGHRIELGTPCLDGPLPLDPPLNRDW